MTLKLAAKRRNLAAPDADITLGRPAGSDDARTGDDGVMGHFDSPAMMAARSGPRPADDLASGRAILFL